MNAHVDNEEGEDADEDHARLVDDLDDMMANSTPTLRETLDVLETSHAGESDDALEGFTDRAMGHGRRAAFCLLAGLTFEALGLAGLVAVARAWPHSHPVWVGVLFAVAFFTFTAMVGSVTGARWERHRTRMREAVGDAMGWKSDYETMIQEHAQRDALDRYDQAREAADEQQREALSWAVDEPPVFLDHESYAASRAASEEYVRRDAAALRGQNAYTEPWLIRFNAPLSPMLLPRPPYVLRKHSVTEGKRLERELCRAINKHSNHDFHRLLAEGANPDGHDGSGEPLRKAVLRGRREHISWLLALGADPNAQPYGRTILAAVMSQVEHFADEEEGGDGDACEWPETIELLARFGANAHIRNRRYDEDDETEGPTAWPFVLKRPVLYEAYMKGHRAFEAADDDAHRLLHDMREAVALDAVREETEAFLNAVRGPRTA